MSDTNDMNDLITFDGGEIKAMGNGKLTGLGVYFSGPHDPDQVGDFFSAETDYDLQDKKSIRLLWEHNLARGLKGELARAEFEITNKGILVTSQLDLSKREHAAIYNEAEKGILGFSSGSSAHLVERVPVGKASWLKSWPIIEISLTRKPVEPRAVVMAVKSLQPTEIEDVLKSFDNESDSKFVLAGIPAIARFCDSVAPTSLKSGSQRSEAAVDAGKEFITIANIYGEGIYSYASRLVRRSENRFLKSARDIHPSTVKDIENLLSEIDRMQMPIDNVKSALAGILKVSQMSQSEQKALDEKARFELWNFCRITGTVPEELNNV